MDAEFAVARSSSVTSATGGTFDQELRELLFARTRLIFIILFAASFVGISVDLLFGGTPPLMSGVTPWVRRLIWLHPASGLLGLAAIYVAKENSRELQIIAFSVLALNLALVNFNRASVYPVDPAYLPISAILFLHASFIPGRAIYQISLGAVAVLLFVLATTLTYVFVPEAQVFWAEISETQTLAGALITGTTGITILAVIAHLTSRTLYSLRKTAHKAKRLGNYFIEKELGKGGMGQVFVARHALICRPTAVKVMEASGDEQQAAAARFEREVQLSATLTHPNTITIYDFGRTPDNRFYYVMEYLEGLDLQALVERFGPVAAARVVFILAQASSSLAEAHSRDIVHRDIKPSNIFLTTRGGLYDWVKVLDFGLAKRLKSDQASALTKTGVVFGTPRYISPEAVTGAEKLDGRSDIYCLGGVGYWLLTGQPPFASSSSVELLVDHIKTVPPKPSQVAEVPIPPELDEILMKCLEKKPDDRFHTAAELEVALRAVQFDDPWSQEKAREWWSLHGIVGDDAFCEVPASEVAAAQIEPALDDG